MPYPVASARGTPRVLEASDSLLTNLVAWWTMDDTAESRIDSVAGYVLQATDNAVATAAGKIGNAASFVKANTDALRAVDSTPFALGNIDFTLALWVNMSTQPANADFVGKWNAGVSQQFIVGYATATDRFRFLVQKADDSGLATVTANTFGAAPTGEWCLIVAWHDTTTDTINIQVNNGAPDSLSHATGVASKSNPLMVGTREGDATVFLDGALDELAIWTRVLTAAERTRLYNGGSGMTFPGTALTDFYRPVRGIWSWFTTPRAAYYNGKTYWSTIDSDGDLRVHEYAHAADEQKSSVLGLAFDVDDHAHGSVMVRDSDKKILVFATRHNDTACTLYVSTNAEDASAFAAGVDLDASLGQDKYDYPSPVQLTGETNDPIYLFYRNLAADWDGQYFSVSTDGGANWAAGTQFFVNTGERPYFQYARNGTTRIDFACTQGHPEEVAGCSIYHFYYSAGHWYKSDGTDLGDNTALPLGPADVTLVYDGTTVESWVWDIAIDESGYPVIVYATFPTPVSDHRYRYARWNGTAWDDNEICTAGGPLAASNYYSAGVTIDKNDVDTVWVSRYVGSQHEIYRYVTADGGANWSGTAITTSSTYQNARPYCPVDAPAGSYPLWWYGTYTTYESYDGLTNIKA